MADDLAMRVRRIYAAVEAAEEHDMQKFPALVAATPKGVVFLQDFRGDMRQEEVENIASTLVHNVASFQDHVTKWAENRGKPRSEIDAAFKGSTALRVIKDLWNNDKHGYSASRHHHSGVAVQHVNVKPVMRLTANAGGRAVRMTFGRDGRPVVTGDGSATVVVDAEIVDEHDNPIPGVGGLYDTATKAVMAWEALLRTFGVDI